MNRKNSDNETLNRPVSNGMKILTVIPIKKGIGKDTLSYFTSENISLGSIVKVPVRNQVTPGLVIDIKDAKDMKADIKALSYNLKKIEKIESHSFLPEKFIIGVKKVSDYFAGSLGSTLTLLLPKIIIENSGKIKFEEKTDKKKDKNIYNDVVLLQTDDEERYGTYRSLIREEFARSNSVYFCLPTTEDILNAKNILEKGIENFTYILHSNLKKGEILSTWEKLSALDHPVLVIGTASFISVPRSDFGSIILEKESSRSYKMQNRPYIDMRTAIEIIARSLGIRLVLGDSLLRIETLWDEKEGRYSSLSPLKFRSSSRAEVEIIQMKSPEDKDKKEFNLISNDLKKLLIQNRENNEHTFLFCGRKGLYPTTVCSDCGKVVSCKICEAPVVLYAKKNLEGQNANYFICHHCGDKRNANELCRYCNSWRLNTLGIGIEKVFETIKELIPNIKVFIMDSDRIKTHKQAKKIRDEFYATPGSVLLGTELALPYLNQSLENSAIVSIDSYFSIPDYQINEKVFHILLSMRHKTNNKMLIQTRKEDGKIFEYAGKGNLLDFWRTEIEDRKITDYPPFKKYIKISLDGEKNTVRKEMEETKKVLEPYKMDVYDAFSPGSSKKFTVHGLLAVEKSPENDPELLLKLKSLPPKFSIRVDPITLL